MLCDHSVSRVEVPLDMGDKEVSDEKERRRDQQCGVVLGLHVGLSFTTVKRSYAEGSTV